MIADRNIIDTFVDEFVQVISKHAEYILVSGYVAISSGRSRATEDIDMIIKRLSKQQTYALHEDLVKAGFEAYQGDAAEIYDYLSANTSVRYIKTGQPLPEMELKFSKDVLDEYQLQTKTKLELTGLPYWFSNINVNIAFKEHLLKSPKDLDDAKHLRIVYKHLLNQSEIEVVCQLINKCRLN